MLMTGAAAEVPERYAIDQQFGSIAFTVRVFGVFSLRGECRRFHGTLSLDLAQPERTHIVVEADADSITMPWEGATQRLRSPAYFDVARYKLIRFTGDRVEVIGPQRYRIEGMLEIRGVTQPQTFVARLVRRSPGPTPDTTIADFVITGQVRRSDFGMTADRILVPNLVDFVIHERITVRGCTHVEQARTGRDCCVLYTGGPPH
jgi:polyisoprenoid-binding protein YceI